MNCCQSCQKRDACGKRYYEGDKQYCEDKIRAYDSLENYIKWLAKGNNFNVTV